jgi:3',5'-cyclic AMP phosphodiesterase CpdA
MRLLLASDLHYSVNIAAEMAQAGPHLPPDTYNHAVDGHLVWHNIMWTERMDRMLDALSVLIHKERPDLVVFLGDLVNTNWSPNVAAVAARLPALPAPVRLVTGNHDVYLDLPETRLQDALFPGDFETGMRHESLGDLDLIFLDIFVYNCRGQAAKVTDPTDDQARANYRDEDIAAALDVLDAYPDRRFLVLGHFPMTAPDSRLAVPGRKIGWRWPMATPLVARLDQAGNLLGIVAGHQHFCHFQYFAHGFHWTLPAMVEYPCAVGLLDVTPQACTGRIVTLLADLAASSLALHHADWTAGEPNDQSFEVTRP